MTTYTVTYSTSNGQPSNDYGGPYTSRKAAIAAARECARQCLPQNSGGRVILLETPQDTPSVAIWWWTEHIEGGYGGQEIPGGGIAAVRL